MATSLAIDDDALNLDLITFYLAKTKHVLLTACNGVQGLELLTQYPTTIDVIMLDRMMPVMDSHEFLTTLGQDFTRNPIPIIWQSAYDLPPQVQQNLYAGALYYLPKLYGKQRLLEVIATALTAYPCDDERSPRSEGASAQESELQTTYGYYRLLHKSLNI